MTTIDERYRIFLEALRLIAAPYDLQRVSVPDYVPLVDDIIDTFQNGFFVLPGPIREGYISKGAVADLITLYSQIDVVSQDSNLCTDEALRGHECWTSIRKLANKVLDEINEGNRNPNLKHVSWIKK